MKKARPMKVGLGYTTTTAKARLSLAECKLTTRKRKLSRTS
jgi:hypothetical protein